ncbi:MAG: hypothetical protein QM811_02345 [Pirellulales bacterium]
MQGAGEFLVAAVSTADVPGAKSTGSGPLTLRAIGIGDGGANSHVLSGPVTVVIDP